MSYAIVFSSRTGNTALLAQTLQEQLPQADCCYFGAPDAAALAADTLQKPTYRVSAANAAASGAPK